MPTLPDHYRIRETNEPVIASVLATATGVSAYATEAQTKEGEAWLEVALDVGQAMSKRAIVTTAEGEKRLYPQAFRGSLAVRIMVKRGTDDDRARLTALRRTLEATVAVTMIPGQGLFTAENLPLHALVDCIQSGDSCEVESEEDMYATELQFDTVCAIRKAAFRAVFGPFTFDSTTITFDSTTSTFDAL